MSRTIKRASAALTALCLLLCCCGCRSDGRYCETEQQYLVSSIGFDNDGGQLCMTVEALAVNAEDSRESMEICLFTGYGDSVEQALADIGRGLARQVQLSHCGLIALGDSLTEYQLRGILAYCYGEQDITLAADMVATPDAAALLAAQKIASLTTGYDIMGVIRQKFENGGVRYDNRYYEVEAKRSQVCSVFMLPYFTLQESGEQSRYTMDGVKIFADDRPVARLNDRQSAVYAMLCNAFGSGTVCLEEGGAVYQAYVSSCRARLQFDWTEQGLSLQLRLDVKTADPTADGAFDDALCRAAQCLVQQSRQQGCGDIFGFGNRVYARSDRVWQAIGNDYAAAYQAGEVQVSGAGR